MERYTRNRSAVSNAAETKDSHVNTSGLASHLSQLGWVGDRF
jgi:hypothetical protein